MTRSFLPLVVRGVITKIRKLKKISAEKLRYSGLYMSEDKNLIGKRKPRGFFTKANREDSIKAIISWYLFLCKVKHNNKPLS